MEVLLTPKELKASLRIGENLYWKLVREGLPCLRLSKEGNRRFDLVQVKTWLEDRHKGEES